MALECARAGADIIINCRSSIDRAMDTATEVRQLGVRADVVSADVGHSEGRSNLLKSALSTGPLHALVCNAGADLLTTELRNAPFPQKLQALLDTDLTGTIELARAAGRHFRETGGGGIITIGWDQSDRGMEGDSGELFAAAKNAVMGFTRSLALSLAPLVRVNCIAPGWIRTAWGETASEYWQQRVLQETPLKRWGEPNDIARLARFLLSNDAGFITGQVINVNGGAVR